MKLYYAPGVCSMAVHVALREVGVAFELERVDLTTHTLQNGDDYRKISPRGYVPLLELDDGDRWTEAAALLQYVADLDPKQRLIGGGNTKERFSVIRWLVFISSELDKGFTPLWNRAAPQVTHDAAEKKLRNRFQELEERFALHEFLSADFSVADAYCYTVLKWSDRLALSLDPYPHLQTYLERIGSRPHIRAAMVAEGLI